MRKLAIDVGDARIGIAISEGSLVLPLEVLQASEEAAAEVMDLAKSRWSGSFN
ncbi:MAG: Holliday junction resolvase RuvX [Actinobacteria bacterium]|nr:Holliday junction resolvase RuvX [Actinomycetota bacterium]